MTSKAKYTYEQAAKIAETYYKDNNYCAPLSIAMVCNVGYGKAFHTLRRLGRRVGAGTSTQDILKAVGLLQGRTIDVGDVDICYKEFGKRLTVNQAPRYMPKGRYLLFVNRHVLSMVDGEVLDWTQGRRHQVKYFLKVS